MAARTTEPSRPRGLPHLGGLHGTAARIAAAVLAVGMVWVILVELREPTTATGLDALGMQVERTVAATDLAERILSVLAWVVSASSTLVLGGIVFRTFITDATGTAGRHRPTAERLMQRAALVGATVGLLALAVRAAAISGDGLATLTDLELLGFVATSPVGDATLLRSAGLLLVHLVLVFPPRTWRRPISVERSSVRLAGELRIDPTAVERATCLLGGLFVLTSYALVGHPQATEPATLLVAVQLLHVTAAATWFGGVTFLALGLRQHRRGGTAHTSARTIQRFATVAGASVAVAVVTGLVLARSQISTLDGLLNGGYGRALLLKGTLVLAVLAVGAYNHRRVVPAIARRDRAPAWRRLRRNLDELRRTSTVESVLIAFGILVLTAAMTSGGF